MSAIGGYFGLELNEGEAYHAGAIPLNTARNALEYLLIAHAYTKLYLPDYYCDVLLQPLEKLNIPFEFYPVDERLEARFDFKTLKEKDAFLYVNYFGLKDEYINRLREQCPALIVDNAQSFFSLPLNGTDTFYSPRKFFGVPDGAYLYTQKKLGAALEQDESFRRFEHLLRRADRGAEDGYPSFTDNERSLNNAPLRRMSALTGKILGAIDYAAVARKRRENYRYLAQHLDGINPLRFDIADRLVPMIYPFLLDNPALRDTLRANRIYTAVYWPNVLIPENRGSIACKYAQGIISLPVDQRTGFAELDKIIKLVK